MTKGGGGMILAVDLRNGGLHVGVCTPDGQWKARFRLAMVERSADEWAFVLRGMFQERHLDTISCSQAILSSVVPAATPILLQALREILQGRGEPLLVGPGIKTGLRIRTDNPAEVGSDLVCNAVAALTLVGAPCIVVDFSTVLSFTVLNPQGDLVGVALAPGLEAAVADLRLRAAQIPQVRLDTPHTAINKNTAESIRAGILIGWAGLVDRIIEAIARELVEGPNDDREPREVKKEFRPPLSSPQSRQDMRIDKSTTPFPYLVGTGCYEDIPVRGTYTFDRWEPYLALQGLYLIARKNALEETGVSDRGTSR
ncbi:hypothetical protein C5O22_01435 [Treponema sp. J25]|nr:hypothetical protein C5O22_01435 [Treponema sp. J25]